MSERGFSFAKIKKKVLKINIRAAYNSKNTVYSKLPDFVARKGVLLVFEDLFPSTVSEDSEIEDLLEAFLTPGENLDLVLALTVSQPPSSRS